MSELLNEEVEAAIDEMVEESIVDTYYRMGYILYEEDLTSARARRAASKAAVYMDTDHERNVKGEMAQEYIRTGKEASRAKAQERAIDKDKSGNAPASAKRAVAANKAARKMFKGVKTGDAAREPGFGARKQGDVKAATRATKGASPEPLEKANRTVQRVIDRENRATRAGVGPNKGESTADNIARGRAMRRKVKKETPKGSN